MLFTLEVLPAEEGDCLLLHWGTRDEPKIALIDGGPGRVFENHLEERLDAIAANLELEPLPLEVVMVSHMDSDHIVGVKKLLAKLRRQIVTNAPTEDRTVAVRRVWLNVFNDVLGDSLDRYYKTLTASLEANVNGRPSKEVEERVEKELEAKNFDVEEAAFHAQTIAAVLAGHGEGRTVRDDHRFLFEQGQCDALNAPFATGTGKATLITRERTPQPIDLEGLDIVVAGPSNAEIKALQKEFDDYIEKNGLTVEAVLAAYADPSIKNLSSIVCLVEFGEGDEKRRILLTGDARGDLMLEGLRAQQLIEGGKLEVDILKVPHHGSDNNVEPAFFDEIVAGTYVLSGDGVHGNPERSTLEWIVDSRRPSDEYDLVLTYDLEHIDRNRKDDFEKKQKRRKPENREEWDHDSMSLQAFFAQKTAANFKFKLHTGARTIDLGDEAVDY